MCIDKILKGAVNQKRFIENLRSKSDYYPKIVYDEQDSVIFRATSKTERTKTVYASTLVRKKHGGIWFTIQVVEILVYSLTTDEENMKSLMEMMMRNVHIVTNLYIVQETIDRVDPNQIDEKQRLKQQIDPSHGR